MPPASIAIASIWLVFGISFGFARFTSEYLNSPQNPIQTAWFVWITLLAFTNLLSIVFFFRQRPTAQIYYYGSLILLFLSGTIFFVTLARSGQLAGTFAAQCFTGALIFTISYLPYRDRFIKR